MDLAQRFNEASEALASRGHRVVVRRARALIGEGDAGVAAEFLADAGDRMRDAALTELAGELRGWIDGGGDVATLLGDDAWASGVASEAQVAADIDHAISTTQVSALAAGLSGAIAPEMPPSEMPPSEMPPLPVHEAPAEAARSIAAVEAPSRLEAREIHLSDGPAPRQPGESLSNGIEVTPPGTPPSAPPVSLETVDGAAAASSAPAAVVEPPPAEVVAQGTPSDEIMRTGFENMPELDAPPSLTVQGPTKEAKGGGAAMGLLVAAIVVAAVVGYLVFL